MVKQCLKIKNHFFVLPDVWTLTQYFVFIGDELTVARDVLSCQGTEMASGLKLRQFFLGGGVTVESVGQETPGCPYWRAGVRHCPKLFPHGTQVQDSRSVLGVGVFKVYSGMGE